MTPVTQDFVCWFVACTYCETITRVFVEDSESRKVSTSLSQRGGLDMAAAMVYAQ